MTSEEAYKALAALDLRATAATEVVAYGAPSTTGAPTAPPSDPGTADRRRDPNLIQVQDLRPGDILRQDALEAEVAEVTGTVVRMKDRRTGGAFTFGISEQELKRDLNLEVETPEMTGKPAKIPEKWESYDPENAQIGDIIRYGTSDKRWKIYKIEGRIVYRVQILETGEETSSKEYSDKGDMKGRWSVLVNAERAGSKGVSFDSVILHQDKKQAILDAIKQVDNHGLIFQQWGFDSVFEKGTAVALLFFGPPGTGKTLMAQAIADRFSYNLKLISTAEIETPEPGGAERNIKAAFESAGEDTVLLFDECDSLISSRKHMGSILAAQVNCLLTELEHYKGIVVFTTNRIEALDEAFDRRLALKVEFDMPDAEHRERIWKRMFPPQAPLADDVDFAELATVEIAGGHIKNVVIQAARMAANLDIPNEEKKITQAILVEALTREVEGNVAFTEAKENEPIYGTRLSYARARGGVRLDRG